MARGDGHARSASGQGEAPRERRRLPVQSTSMNRPATAAFAALEALLVVGIGVGLPVAVTSLLWAFQYGLQLDWIIFWRASIDTWLVGHGVDVTLRLGSAAAEATGSPGPTLPSTSPSRPSGSRPDGLPRHPRGPGHRRDRAPGRRPADDDRHVRAAVDGPGRHRPARARLAVAVAGRRAAAARLRRARTRDGRDHAPSSRRRPGRSRRLRHPPRRPGAARRPHRRGRGLRAGVAVVSVVVACAAVVVALLLLTHFAQIITLYEGAHGVCSVVSH